MRAAANVRGYGQRPGRSSTAKNRVRKKINPCRLSNALRMVFDTAAPRQSLGFLLFRQSRPGEYFFAMAVPFAHAVAPIILEGKAVRLEPLSSSHLNALCDVGLDPELWRWTLDIIDTRAGMQAYLEEALAGQIAGTAQPFVIMEKAASKIVGSTRFGNVDAKHRRVEIGWTWIARPWQRTVVNTEAKYLLLRHAFETWRCLRVELKTDALNEQSRKAIQRLGAIEEGILRQHMITANGRIRDTVYYSVLAPEWPQVKKKLEWKLQAQQIPTGAPGLSGSP